MNQPQDSSKSVSAGPATESSSSLDPSAALARLVFGEGEQRQEINLEPGPGHKITIGRGQDNRLVINEQLVSRNHCVVAVTPTGYAVQDLDSANGTFVNGERVSGLHLLQAGDRIKVGSLEMVFEAETLPPMVRYAAFLSWEVGGQETRREIGAGLTLGRSSESDLPVDDLGASRFHCRIEMDQQPAPTTRADRPTEPSYTLVDLGSTNGTFLNDEQVRDRVPIHDGDLVRVGQTSFRFELVTQMVLQAPPGADAEALAEAQTMLGAVPVPVSSFRGGDAGAGLATAAGVAVTAPGPAIQSTPAEVAERPAPLVAAPARVAGQAAVIEVRDVIKEFDSPGGKVRILKSVSLQVHPGEFVGVRGPSGSGKSTLLNMITGIDRPTSGDVMVAGQLLNKLSENKMARWRGNSIGVIFQFFQLLPTLTVIENIMLPMDFCRKWKPRERQERAMALLKQVELAEHAYKLPSMLSGGQQQRAAIARALANDPPLIVADEPTGNLDSKTADRVFMLFSELVARGTTFLMVTHDVELAARIPRVLEVLDGELFERRN